MDAGPHRVSVPEQARFCPTCDGPVGRGRGGRPGRERGVCPWCRDPFDLTPALAPGDVVDGLRARYRVREPWRPGARGWLYLADPLGPDRAGGERSDGGWTGGERGDGGVVLTRIEGPEGPAAGALAVAEPESLLDLDVPGLVGARDVATAVEAGGRSRHLVLDHVPGSRPDLSGRPRPVAALDVVLGICVPLAALHARGLLHADVTPANVLVSPGTVTLMDLGSVRRTDDRTSDVWGTTGFLAPEIVPDGAGPSVASEIYALGRTLAVLLLDFDHTRRYALRLPDPTTTVLLAEHPELAALLARATALEPSMRHPDVAAFAAAARAVRAGLVRTAADRSVHDDSGSGGASGGASDDHCLPITHDRAATPGGVGAATP